MTSSFVDQTELKLRLVQMCLNGEASFNGVHSPESLQDSADQYNLSLSNG